MSIIYLGKISLFYSMPFNIKIWLISLVGLNQNAPRPLQLKKIIIFRIYLNRIGIV